MARLSLDPSSRQLRETLDRISGLPGEQVSLRAKLIEDLRSEHAHEIGEATDPDVAGLSLAQFTCFMHAFRLAASQAVVDISSALDNVFPGSEFVAFLVAHHLTQVAPDEVRDGDVVLYSEGAALTHAGVVRSGRVVSKWGSGGLWQHRLFEVPQRYGNHVAIYRPLEAVVAERAFVGYAEQREGKSLIDDLLDSQGRKPVA